MYKELYFKELAHVIMEAGKYKSARWVSGLETQEELILWSNLILWSSAGEFLLAQERSVFCSLQAFS